MLIDSRGIVLSALRYSDSSFIVRVYTEQSGQKSFMVRVGKGRSAMSRMVLLQPLTLVTVSYSNDDRQGLRIPRMFERAEMLHSTPFDTVKSSIAIFMAEVAGRSLQEETPDMALFAFLYDTILLLDREEHACSNLHLKFLIEFSRFMGCHPSFDHEDDHPWFDLREGEFCAYPPVHPYCIGGPVRDALVHILTVPMGQHWQVQMSNAHRRELLQALVDYYRFHVDGMREIRSHHVLEEVMG
jgi:DNA repair protein RecO (recombination protein O)